MSNVSELNPVGHATTKYGEIVLWNYGLPTWANRPVNRYLMSIGGRVLLRRYFDSTLTFDVCKELGIAPRGRISAMVMCQHTHRMREFDATIYQLAPGVANKLTVSDYCRQSTEYRSWYAR